MNLTDALLKLCACVVWYGIKTIDYTDIGLKHFPKLRDSPLDTGGNSRNLGKVF